ncbi:hypothetical protein GTO91_12540 [Heliobacterium undosum]|uniref:Flagellar protein FliL n=1 Tax=Heliomicrobium undosum TaxID=121734 RepID=A0A845LCA1_9FIRM|nr:flagellar basal body-associated FliL family protein [Heliomicrobium undosum]MZP30541.1 hypothetical protein [Heliomicrobium undosum]
MAETENAPKKKPLNMKLIIIAVAVLVSAAIIAVAVFKFFISPDAVSDHTPKASAPKTVGVLFEAGDFTTNLADPGGKRFLKAKVILELNEEKKDEKKLAELKEHLPVIRDRILYILSAKTVEDFQVSDSKEKVKKDILVALNKQFGADKFRNVYFQELVYQ